MVPQLLLSCVLVAGLGPAALAAEAWPPLLPLLTGVESATAAMARHVEAGEASRRGVVTAYDALKRAEDAAIAAPEPGRTVAMAVLGRAKAGYDAAVASERIALAAAAAARAGERRARQMLREAAERYAADGAALAHAVALSREDFALAAASPWRACAGDECVTIAEREAAALATLGLTANGLTAVPLSELAPAWVAAGGIGPAKALARDTAAAREAAEDAVVAARTGLAKAIPAWDAALTTALQTYNQPAANSHAEELLTQALEDLARQAAAFRKTTPAYVAANAMLEAAQAKSAAADAALERTLTELADLGRALIDSAALAARGAAATAAKPGRACAAAGCLPLTPMQTAAFAVIGAVDGPVAVKTDAWRDAAPYLAAGAVSGRWALTPAR